MHGTREKLIDTARQLFAERGVENVSLREISRAAKQGNVSALQYHFGDREGLLSAVMEPYHLEIDARRNALLDHLESGEPDLRGLAGALVRPPASLLGDPGGRQFLRIFGHLINLPHEQTLHDATEGIAKSWGRWRRMVVRWIPEEAVRMHRRFTAMQLAHHELGRRAELNRRDQVLFTSHLVDLTAAILAAPVSEETRRALDKRTKRRGS